MKIFLDSAELDEIKAAKNFGVLDGVTTNPSLIKKAVQNRQQKGEKTNMQEYIAQMLSEVDGAPVSLEVVSLELEQIINEARTLYRLFNHIADNVYVKIPVNTADSPESNNFFQGIQAIKALSREGIRVNCTLIFTPEQALLAAKAGAAYVSPFAGRIDDWIRQKNNLSFDKKDYFPATGLDQAEDPEAEGLISGIDLVEQCVTIFDIYKINTEVLAASLRNARQVRECALVGAHIATVPYEVLLQLIQHQKTTEGVQKFAQDVVPEYANLFSIKY